MRDFIPQIEPWIDNSELQQLKRVIKSTYVTEDALTQEFEDLIKKLTGAKYAVAVTNGTAALYCCLKALGIGDGDEVIVPNITFIATSNAVLMAGAIPVFCEIDEQTLCIDPDKIEKLINFKTKAIMPVHLYGQSADMDRIKNIAQNHNLKIIEDAAQGVGVKFDDKHVGTFGECGILSFYGNKTITCGEGGVILTEDSEIAKKCYRLKNHGRSSKGIFKHNYIGFNFCFTEMQAAIGISQLHKLPQIIKKKQQICDLYWKELNNISDFKPIRIDKRTTPVFWFTSFLTKKKKELQLFLKENNIQTRDFFYPLNMQPCYSDMKIDDNFSVSKDIYSRGISLPSSYNLTVQEQHRVIKLIKEFYK